MQHLVYAEKIDKYDEFNGNPLSVPLVLHTTFENVCIVRNELKFRLEIDLYRWQPEGKQKASGDARGRK